MATAARTSRPSASAHRRRWLAPIFGFLLLALGCSAAGLVQRATPTPPPTAVLVPTFTPTGAPIQSLIIVTPPSEGRPGIIIIPPGMDPNAVIPMAPTAPPPPVGAQPPADAQPPAPATTPVPGATAPPPAGDTAPLPAAPGGDAAPLPTVPVATVPPLPTETPTPSATPTPTTPPTPFVQVASGFATLRTGPGVQYPLMAQLGPGIPVAIIGASADGQWLQICCISGDTAWVPVQHVDVVNDLSAIPVAAADAPPTPTETPFPTETPTETPTPTATPYPFQLEIGPQFFPTNNEFLTIWARLYVGPLPEPDAAEGYHLKVLFEGIERPNALSSTGSMGHFDYTAPPGSGNRVLYNYKYEYRPPDPKAVDPNATISRLQLLGTGTWTVYVADGAGNQLSNPVTFTTAPENPNREVYIGWNRIR